MSNSQNITLLSTKDPHMSTIKIDTCDRGYFLYSKYYPSRDAKAFAEGVYDERASTYLVYGLGLGYHINELEDIIQNKSGKYHIYIIEFNKEILKLATENINLDRIFQNENITLIMMNNEIEAYNELYKILSIKDIKIAIHQPSLNIIPNEFIELKYILEEYIVQQNSIEVYSTILDHNFQSNIKSFDKNVDTLFNKYKNRPLYLVAAGPSLDKNIQELSNVKGSGIILSVGRAVRSLLAAGILPDYIIITDPSDFLYNMQLKGLDIKVPIIVLSTCDKNVMLQYKGTKYIALQQGYDPAEEYAKINNHQLVRTGGSVATTGLDVAIRMGCNPIVFVGQDLAFTNNKTHSDATFSKDTSSRHNLRETKDMCGKVTYTSKTLSIYLKWLERRIMEEEDVDFIDATEGGMKIQGTKVVNLKDTVSRHP